MTGTFIADLFDLDNTRHVSASYSVVASATWERKTITFPADTTGALTNDNARRFDLRFWLGVGSDFSSGTLNTTWASNNNANRAVGQTNLAAATNNYWQITGVQLETGPVATPFEFEPFEATLRKCQRYYYLHANGNEQLIMNANFYTNTAIQGILHFPTTMRTDPTASVTTGTNYYRIDSGSTDDFDTIIMSGLKGTNAASLYATANISGTSGRGCIVYNNNASASIAFSAEL